MKTFLLLLTIAVANFTTAGPPNKLPVSHALDIVMADEKLIVKSNNSGDLITRIQILDGDVVVVNKFCQGVLECEADVSGLASGPYMAKIITTLGTTYHEISVP